MTQEEFNKLKRGDRIKFRRDLIVGNVYSWILYPEMAANIGKIVTVKGFYHGCSITIKESEVFFLYHREMFVYPFKFGK